MQDLQGRHEEKYFGGNDTRLRNSIGWGLGRCLALRACQITTLSLSDCGFTAVDCFALAAGFRGLANARCDDVDGIQPQGRFAVPLVTLELNDNCVGDEGCLYLAQMLVACGRLHHIDLAWNGITAAGMEDIVAAVVPHCPIKYFVVDGNVLATAVSAAPPTRAVAQLLRQSKSLEELSLYGCFYMVDDFDAVVRAVAESAGDLVQVNISPRHDVGSIVLPHSRSLTLPGEVQPTRRRMTEPLFDFYQSLIAELVRVKRRWMMVARLSRRLQSQNILVANPFHFFSSVQRHLSSLQKLFI